MDQSVMLPLPSSLRTNLARRDAPPAFPAWVTKEDTKSRDRKFRVYQRSLKRESAHQIATDENISISMVFTDIRDVKALSKHIFFYRLETLVLDQVEVHEEIVREARSAITDLRNLIADKSSIGDKKVLTPAMAKALAELLRVIADQEVRIEELFGIRGPTKRPPQEDGDTDDGDTDESKGDLTVIIDARTQVAGEPGDSSGIIEGESREVDDTPGS